MYYTIKQYNGGEWTDRTNWVGVEEAPSMEQATKLVGRFMQEDGEPRINYWIEVSA